MKKLISIWDKHVLSISVILILILIPLYPKFPFIRIPDTYISIRLEDFLIALLTLIFTIQLVRRKASVSKYYVIAFGAYWGLVFISLIFGSYIFKTVEFPRIGFLHAGRRVQYMIPFFISFAAVSKLLLGKKDLITSISRFTTTISWVVITIMLYALGQKSSPAFQPTRDFFENIANTSPTPIVKSVAYFLFRFFDFPAVQTMNAEFAKIKTLVDIKTLKTRLSKVAGLGNLTDDQKSALTLAYSERIAELENPGVAGLDVIEA